MDLTSHSSGFVIPHDKGFIISSGNHVFAISANRNGVHIIAVSFESLEFTLRINFPFHNRPIFAAEYKVSPELMACCVTLGFQSVDTRSNARETAAWKALSPNSAL